MPTITSYQSGIDFVVTGTAGTDYSVEQFSHDPRGWDFKIIALKPATLFGFAHNARNQYGTVSTNLAPAEYPGIIRYIIGRDRWLPGPTKWTSFSSIYSGQIELEDLEYESGVSVVGTLGPKPGIALTKATRATYYERGMVDQFGNEYIIITVGDDDRTKVPPVGGEGYAFSDGKVFLISTVRKTPTLEITASGNAQFRSTTAKRYFDPALFNPETMIWGNTGSVSVKILDIGGANIHYRIVSSLESGEAYTAAGASSVTLTDSAFSDGIQYLQYYYAGNESFKAWRKITKIPTAPTPESYPSYGETHGNALWGSYTNLNAVKARLTTSPYNTAYNNLKNQDSYTGFGEWDAYATRGFGERLKSVDPLANAFVAAVEGFGFVKPGKSKSFAQYAKEKLLYHPRCMDPIGLEMHHPSDQYPCRELNDRGYRNSPTVFSAAFAYDLLISGFKISDGFSNGISPVEDLHIREILAGFAFEGAQWMQGVNPTVGPGMWGYSRTAAALACAVVMPNYSTPWYGTSGANGAAATYLNCPFPDVAYTWRQLFSKPQELPVTAYPNLEYNDSLRALCDAVHPIYGANNWDDKGSYATWGTTLGSIQLLMLMKAVHFGEYDSDMVACMTRCVSDDGNNYAGMRASKKEDVSSGSTPIPAWSKLFRHTLLLLYNSLFQGIANAGLAWSQGTTDTQSIGSAFQDAKVYGLVFYDRDLPTETPVDGPEFTVGLTNQDVDEGDDVTFTVTVTGSPTPVLVWQKDGVSIVNDGRTLVLSNVTTADAGTYTVIASNSGGSTSTSAVLTVNEEDPPPVITGATRGRRTILLMLISE